MHDSNIYMPKSSDSEITTEIQSFDSSDGYWWVYNVFADRASE